MDNNSIIKAYKRYERIYDTVFGPILDPGRKLALKKINNLSCKRVLEVGVGTGISLPLYSRDTSVVGIDVSPHMLSRAKERVISRGLSNVTLELMDAENMSFPDGYFDTVTAMYVASVAPNPLLLISEMKRVCKTDGHIFILNHFSNRNGIVKKFEKSLSPFAKVIGFRPVFPLDKLIDESSLDVEEIVDVNAFGLWSLIHAKNDRSSSLQ